MLSLNQSMKSLATPQCVYVCVGERGSYFLDSFFSVARLSDGPWFRHGENIFTPSLCLLLQFCFKLGLLL